MDSHPGLGHLSPLVPFDDFLQSLNDLLQLKNLSSRLPFIFPAQFFANRQSDGLNDPLQLRVFPHPPLAWPLRNGKSQNM